MNADELIDALLAVGPEDKYAAVRAIPGSGNHDRVVRYTRGLRGPVLDRVVGLAPDQQASFVKALAVYEETVGGLGSVTALQYVFRVISDPDHAAFDWVLANTRSYWYYSGNAASFAELHAERVWHSHRRQEREASEREREAEARQRKAERATQNLYNAVRRGDIKAVRALLGHGASSAGTTPEGVSLAEYARASGRTEIAELLGSRSTDTAGQ